MTAPLKKKGCLTQKNGKQVTVIKMFPGKKRLMAKSAQIQSQYEATVYEWENSVAFSFKCEGKHCCPKVGNGLELDEHADLPNNLGNENRFMWADADPEGWKLLKHQNGGVVKFLCCAEDGKLFLKDKSQSQSEIKADCFLYKIVDARESENPTQSVRSIISENTPVSSAAAK